MNEVSLYIRLSFKFFISSFVSYDAFTEDIDFSKYPLPKMVK